LDLDIILAEKRTAFQDYLAAYLTSREGTGGIWEACAYSLSSGGKRLRPILAMLACEASGSEAALSLPVGLAIEMIHTFSLIHDDLPAIDNDDLRRGRPTCHRQFGEASAILAGDALIFSAISVIAEADYSAQIKADLLRELARAGGVDGLVQGEHADIMAEGRTVTPDEIRTIHRQKTAALFELCMYAGARVAGADAETTRALTSCGQHLGLAFQVIDDILDVIATPDTLGKTTGKDARQGKATMVGILGLEEARRWAQQATDTAVDCLKGLSGTAVEALRTLTAQLLLRVM